MSDSKRRVSGWEKGYESAESLGVGRQGCRLAGEDWECPQHQVFAKNDLPGASASEDQPSIPGGFHAGWYWCQLRLMVRLDDGDDGSSAFARTHTI